MLDCWARSVQFITLIGSAFITFTEVMPNNTPTFCGRLPIISPTVFNQLLDFFQSQKWMYLRVVSEKAMATRSNTISWKIPWAEEPGRLQSMGSLRVGHDWSDLAAAAAAASRVRLFVTPWMVAHQAPLSLEFSRQEYWSGLSNS